MDKQVRPIPEGYHTITPYLIVKNASEALEFYKRAFNAREIFRMETPEKKIGHCEFEIGDSRIMMADEFPQMGATAPSDQPVRSFSLLIYVNNVDEVFNRAVEAGAKVLRPLQNEFYGDRMGTVQDPFGHNWHLGQQIEKVSPEEMKRRSDKMWKDKHVS